MLSTPILLITFNRPNHVRLVLTEIRKQQPVQLFVFQDGARDGNKLDQERVQQVRDVIKELVDWPCELHTLYQEKNLGCGPGPITGINWFFSNVDKGIILEDDCIPSESLFEYYTELLDRYKEDEEIALITGTNALGRWRSWQGDYFISKFGMTMGAWATWKRSWTLFDADLSTWMDSKTKEDFRKFVGVNLYKTYQPILDYIYQNQVTDVWDYQWAYSCLSHKKYRIVSTINQMSNIGFCEESTHTPNSNDRRANMKLYTCSFPLKKITVKKDLLFDYIMYQRFERLTPKGFWLKVFLKIVEFIYRR